MSITKEIQKGERFEFGANWKQFLRTLNEARIAEAESSLKEMLGVSDLKGKRFLDIGCGSGLFSLAAKRLGAEVHSFDYDPQSVGCAQELKERFYTDDDTWTIEEGSALDPDYLRSLGKFDIVYSWGVLHHTGAMMDALTNAMIPVSETGTLFIAIYNDQGIISDFWTRVKKTYCSGFLGKAFIQTVFIPYFTLRSMLVGIIKYKNPLGDMQHYKAKRGMSVYHDWKDWLGGYPFEVATPELLFELYKPHGFVLEKLVTTNRLGCNQLVFRKVSA